MADQDDNSTSLLSTSEENTGEPNYDAIIGQDGPNLGKFAQPTIIGNVSLIIIYIYIYNIYMYIHNTIRISSDGWTIKKYKEMGGV